MSLPFRMAMTWLHDWAGLLTGWVLFVIALAGTLSVYRAEIGDWARPEAACCAADTAESGAAALRWLARHAPDAPAWFITPADARTSTTQAVWAEGGGFRQVFLDARRGAPDAVRATLGGEFFYRLHFELLLPFPWGRWIAGAAALALLLTLLTGIAAHRRVFSDLFTFRPGLGARSWLDAHNLVSIAALPFHLMMAFTGALTLANLIMPWGAAAVPGGAAGWASALTPGRVAVPASGVSAPLPDLRALLLAGRARLGGEFATIAVQHPGDRAAAVTLTRGEAGRIGAQTGMMTLAAATGQVLAVQEERRPAVAAFDVLYGLHTARFAGALLRLLYFLSGLALTAMIGTGLNLWTEKRAGREQSFGARLVRRLNAAVIGGTPAAFAAFFLANRLLPAAMPGREKLEVRLCCGCWLGLLAWAMLARNPASAWRVLLWLTALGGAAIPLLDAACGTWRWTAPALGVDAWAALLSAAAALAARRVKA